MDALVLTEEQELLRQSAADFASQRSPISRMRSLRDAKDEIGFEPALWKEMAGLGWPGIILPEEYGGLGLGYAELVLVLEELGGVLAPEPFLGTVLLGANLLLLGGSEDQKAATLPAIAAGDRYLALAHHENGVRHQLHHVSTKAEASSNGFRLSGDKDLVVDGTAAQHFILSARTSGGPSDHKGISLFLVDAAAKGLTRTRQHLIDSRGVSAIRLDDVEVPADAVIGTVDEGAKLLDSVVDRALVGLAAEMLGGTRRAFEMTIDYLREREQFGVRIGSFQALKHRAARMFVEVELARSTVMAAARALDSGDEDIPRLAALAKATLSDTYVHVTNEAVQMHGGIGMTDEHDIGFFLKRARATEFLFGDGGYHRDRWALLSGY